MKSPYRKKLIEVALPLPEINDASAYDKMPGIGPHPKGIHQWWARLPLPIARAVLFASVVDDPSEHTEKWPTETEQNIERERLFDILRRMMQKKLHEHPEVYAIAHEEILKYCDGQLPAVFDPFAGGGSIPLEANRLGFETYAGDLNPVAVLLNKCNLELTPKWVGQPPINPEDRSKMFNGIETWPGTNGLAADIRYYGQIIQKRAQTRFGNHYPSVELPKEYGSGRVNVIAWIWARTVTSPNPAAKGKHVPLISTYWLSSKDKLAWLDPIIDKEACTYRFEIKTGTPKDRKIITSGTKLGRGAKFKCIITNEPISDKYIKDEAKAGRIGFCLIAIVAETKKGRCYLPAENIHSNLASIGVPEDAPNEVLIYDSRYLTPPGYGMTSIDKLFTPRQLNSILILSELIQEIKKDIEKDASNIGFNIEATNNYSQVITTFLALTLDRCCDFNNSLCRWSPSNQKVMNLFGRQAIPMVWDFAEANILGDSVGAWQTCNEYIADCIEVLTISSGRTGYAHQIDAANGINGLTKFFVSTDPPYYDNVPYADIADFFYVWLRRTIGSLYPDLFSTVLVPKMPELTASPQRFNGNKAKAKEHFESGFRKAFSALNKKIDLEYPLTVYYAFKQSDEESGIENNESEDEENSIIDLTTGWETLLEALISSGFQITATWPVRASQTWRMRAMKSNALASYVVLACRPRATELNQTSSMQFRQELKRTLPEALRHLQQGNIAPVDFAQAAIGPGMAIYSRYSKILESNGKPLTVRAALGMINQTLTEVLSEQEDEFDNDTRWALTWFEQHGFGEGDYGEAELLSKAKVTSVPGLQQAGIISSKSGKVRLLRPDELPKDWDPTKDQRKTVWEMTHHLLRVYHYEKKGDSITAGLLCKLGSEGEITRDLAYRLFNLCEKKSFSQEAQGYNALVLGWPEIAKFAREQQNTPSRQGELFT